MAFVEELKLLQKNNQRIQKEKLDYEQHLLEEVVKLNPIAIDIVYNRFKEDLRLHILSHDVRPDFIYSVYSDFDTTTKQIFIQKFIEDGLICIDNIDYGFDIQLS